MHTISKCINLLSKPMQHPHFAGSNLLALDNLQKQILRAHVRNLISKCPDFFAIFSAGHSCDPLGHPKDKQKTLFGCFCGHTQDTFRHFGSKNSVIDTFFQGDSLSFYPFFGYVYHYSQENKYFNEDKILLMYFLNNFFFFPSFLCFIDYSY